MGKRRKSKEKKKSKQKNDAMINMDSVLTDVEVEVALLPLLPAKNVIVRKPTLRSTLLYKINCHKQKYSKRERCDDEEGDDNEQAEIVNAAFKKKRQLWEEKQESFKSIIKLRSDLGIAEEEESEERI